MLKIKRMAIDTHRENVAFLARTCPLYCVEEFQALAKIEIIKDGKRMLATLNIVDDEALVGRHELGLSEQGFQRFDLPEGAAVTIAHATPPASLEQVRAKIQGHILGPEAYTAIIRDVALHRYSRMEIAAFLIACASFMTTEEVLSLTRAMVAVGDRMDWNRHPIVDKHCIGGIPGNRTSMIVVPIAAAHGLSMPKTSSRAITSPAGTADTMQVLARVDIGAEEMRDIVGRVGGCLVWGGKANLSPADDILISVERPLGIDSREQMVASILSKKLAAGSTHLLIDLPVGPSAKVRSPAEAVRLRKLFEHIADSIGLLLEVVITDGRQPVGRGIGPVLEARDVMKVLENAPDAPRDLRERALHLAGMVLEFDEHVRGGTGLQRARELLDSGEALRAMRQIIEAQGANTDAAVPGHLTRDVLAPTDGVVEEIDCYRIARVARLAGAPAYPGAGIDLFKKIGEAAAAGEPLYRIHAGLASDFQFAVDMAATDNGYRLAALK
jgi:thymidine phosphorylase